MIYSTYSINEQYIEKAVEAQNKLREYYLSVINPLREAMVGARYLVSGDIDKKHRVKIDEVLEHDYSKMTVFIRRSWRSVYLFMRIPYQTNENTVGYIEHNVYLASVEQNGNITLDEDDETGGKACYKTHPINSTITAEEYWNTIKKIREYEDKVRTYENLIQEERKKITAFINN